MDINACISSGILESYVLGNVSAQEQQEVECMAKIYPEIKNELLQLQDTMEQYAMANAVAPPASVKKKIMAAIDQVEQEKPVSDKVLPMEKNEQQGKLIPMGWKIAVAATVLLTIGFATLWFNAKNSSERYKSQMAEMKNKQDTMLQERSSIAQQIQQEEKINFLLVHSATREINLQGTKKSPAAAVRVYWNTTTEDVLLKVDDLPALPDNKQYQLWAIVSGQPVDMGVFNLAPAQAAVVQMPVKVKDANAFAITMEQKGGSPSPTMSAMYVMGKI